MANRNNYTQHKHTGMNIFATILAIIILAGCTLGGLELWGTGKQKPSNWGKDDSVAIVQPEKTVDPTPLPANGGMEIPERVEDGEADEKTGIKSNGIALMSTLIPIAQYSAYGIPPAAEKAKTVTATVLPDNDAPNTAVKWEIEWSNPQSAWAKQKEEQGVSIEDFVTISFDNSDFQKSKTCTVSCLQAFGEQITLTATALDDETKYATVNIDYVQQIKSVSVNIGNIPVVLGGNTNVTIKTRVETGGDGGQVSVQQTLTDVYTIKNTYTPNIKLQHEASGMGENKYVAYSHTSGGHSGGTYLSYDRKEEALGDNIYFDRRLFNQFHFYAGSAGWDGSGDDDCLFSSVSQANDLAQHFNDGLGGIYGGPLKNKVLWTMTVTLTSEQYTFTYTSEIVWAEIDERVPITNVNVNDGQDIIFP